MAELQNVVRDLRKVEKPLQRQLDGVRAAISTLNGGSAGGSTVSRVAADVSGAPVVRKRRKMSRQARAEDRCRSEGPMGQGQGGESEVGRSKRGGLAR